MLVHFQKTVVTRAFDWRANARRPRRITKVGGDRIGRRRLLFLARQAMWKGLTALVTRCAPVCRVYRRLPTAPARRRDAPPHNRALGHWQSYKAKTS
jgi:hypothetical protein